MPTRTSSPATLAGSGRNVGASAESGTFDLAVLLLPDGAAFGWNARGGPQADLLDPATIATLDGLLDGVAVEKRHRGGRLLPRRRRALVPRDRPGGAAGRDPRGRRERRSAAARHRLRDDRRAARRHRPPVHDRHHHDRTRAGAGQRGDRACGRRRQSAGLGELDGPTRAGRCCGRRSGRSSG